MESTNITTNEYIKKLITTDEYIRKLEFWSKEIEEDRIDENDISEILFVYTLKARTNLLNRYDVLRRFQNNLLKIKPMIAKVFKCEDDEVALSLTPQNENKVKIVLGDAVLENGKTYPNVKIVYGNVTTAHKGCECKLPELVKIFGNAVFERSGKIDIPNLRYVGGNAIFGSSEIDNIDNVRFIGGVADFIFSNIKRLNARIILEGAYFHDCQITSFGPLRELGGRIHFGSNNILKEKFEREFAYNENAETFKRKSHYLNENVRNLEI